MIIYMDLARTTVDSTRSALVMTVPYHPPSSSCSLLSLLDSPSYLYSCSHLLSLPQFVPIRACTEHLVYVLTQVINILSSCPSARVLSILFVSLHRPHPHARSHALTLLYDPICCYRLCYTTGNAIVVGTCTDTCMLMFISGCCQVIL